MLSTVLGLVLSCVAQAPAAPGSALSRPIFSLDAPPVGPATPYAPQPGDIFLATDQSILMRIGHQLVGGKGVHHSGFVFARPDGSMALIEAGPFNDLDVRVMDPFVHMSNHVRAGDKVWIRRRAVPLTPDQSARLTAFAMAQSGKPFALGRLLAFVSPLSKRGILKTPFLGKVRVERRKYFCAELLMDGFAAAGLVDSETTRPSATVPRDLFFGASSNPYIDRHITINCGWDPPARWLPGCP